MQPYAGVATTETSLLSWYAPRRRRYPWRRGRPDAYRTLVAEVMLQQTQAERVARAYRAFLARFPSVGALAASPRAAVVRAWAGLGYNRRAVALHEAARLVDREHAGRVPVDPRALERLPGVGPYTAAAVASIAGGVPVAAVDTNVRRVVARLALAKEPAEATEAEIRAAADALVSREDPGGWNQAAMDLGRELCRVRPRCGSCPLASACRFHQAGRSGSADGRMPGRQGRFEGSARQLRGDVVAALRERRSVSLLRLGLLTGRGLAEVADAVRSLASDGLVSAGAAALDGRSSGRLRLAD